MADKMKLALRGVLLSVAAYGVTDEAVACVDAVVDTLRAENERLRKALEEALPFIGYQAFVPDIVDRAREALEATDG